MNSNIQMLIARIDAREAKAKQAAPPAQDPKVVNLAWRREALHRGDFYFDVPELERR